MRNKGRHNNPSSKTHDGGKPVTKPPRNIAVVIPQPFTVRQDPTSENNEERREERNYREASLAAAQGLNRITIIGIVVTVLGSFLVYLSYRLTKEQFIRAERPYYMVTSVDIEHPAEGDSSPFIVGITEVNYGKEPALKVITREMAYVGADAEEKAVSFYKSLGTGRFDLDKELSVSSLAPNGAATAVQALHVTPPISMREAAVYSNTDRWLVVIGKFQYEDTFGTKYETSFCKEHLKAGMWFDCPKYNELK